MTDEPITQVLNRALSGDRAAHEEMYRLLYAELLKPEGPIVFAGEHLSYQQTWQEGAASSAHEALKLVAAMAKAKAA